MIGSTPAAADHDLLISKIASSVRNHAKGAIRAVLFGSLARGEAQATSDVDLLLVAERC